MNKKHLFALALLLTVCCFSQILVAQNAAPGKRSYKLDYQVLLPNSNGYQSPIRAKISLVPAVPLAKDQYFHVMVHSTYNADMAETCSISSELILPAGKTSAEVELLSNSDSNNYCMLRVERGRKHTNGDGNDLFIEQIYTDQNSGSRSWLLISSNAPKNKCSLSKVHSPNQPITWNNSNFSAQQQFTGSFSGNQQIPGLKKFFGRRLTSVLNGSDWHALHPSELPETWVGLSSVRYVLISNDEFQSLTQVPAYRKLIEQWVAAGGCLIVFNADNSLSHAGSVFPSLLGKERATPARLWSTSIPSLPRNKKTPPKPASELTAKDAVASSSHVNGQVSVMVAPDKAPNYLSELNFPKPNVISNQNFTQTRRNRYHSSPIPGVGQPPIALFGVFAGLFLFLIGPVILIIVTLNNNRRFLFFLVPLFSFLTCTSILGYAIVVDFNKQLGRTETITALDSRSGTAFTQASSAYYCGNQPSYYAYDHDTFVQTAVDQSSGYRISKLSEENRLSSPRIQPRKIHEVYTAKPYPTQQRFLVADSAKQPGTPEVTNLLGSRIDQASFRYQGKTYLVQDVAPKQKSLGVETNWVDCRKALLETVGAQQIRGGSPFFNANSSRINSAINRSDPDEFVAIIDSNPAIEPLIEPFDYKLQLHVVHGKYK